MNLALDAMFRRRSTSWLLAAVLALGGVAAQAADDDAALDLEHAPAAEASPASSTSKATGDLRLYLEAAGGRLYRRGGLQDAGTSRLSLDYNQTFRPVMEWRLVLSNRIDHIEPVEEGQPATVNSLREAYASWQQADGSLILDVGRLNLRHGPAYGFNPTDYFRDGALRVITTADPMALRENRLGTVMLRAQKLWPGGALDLVLAPKLANAPSADGISLDWGATNRVNRALVSFSGQWSERASYQAMFYGEQGRKPQFGLNGTALLSDALVVHGELSRGQEPQRSSSVWGQATGQAGRNRVVAGLTYTTPSNLALTLEYAYNGAAPTRDEWDRSVATLGANALGAYLLDVQQRQDSASRSAWLLYATQKNLGMKKLDLSAFVRINGEDHSRFAWAELRYHWDRLDLALQWFGARGTALSEYGLIPDRQRFQLLGTWRF